MFPTPPKGIRWLCVFNEATYFQMLGGQRTKSVKTISSTFETQNLVFIGLTVKAGDFLWFEAIHSLKT